VNERPRCCDCGRFFSGTYAWKMVYSGVLPEPYDEIYRCSRCLESKGPFVPQSGIRPEFSCGISRASMQEQPK
jgi:hypothetical protein